MLGMIGSVTKAYLRGPWDTRQRMALGCRTAFLMEFALTNMGVPRSGPRFEAWHNKRRQRLCIIPITSCWTRSSENNDIVLRGAISCWELRFPEGAAFCAEYRLRSQDCRQSHGATFRPRAALSFLKISLPRQGSVA